MIYIYSEDLDIVKIADSGQCFRMTQCASTQYSLIAFGRALLIDVLENGACLHCTPQDYEQLWRGYLDMDTDYQQFRAAAAPEDGFLCTAVDYGRGIRILQQDPWEMLVTFIISQRKSIPAIKGSIEQLCRRAGESIDTAYGNCFAFPSPARMAQLTLSDLRDCALGYRAGYVHTAAQMVSSGVLDLERLALLDDEALYQSLLSVPGVGPKVASCVMLFGFHRLCGFPRDVWINRIIDTEYQGNFPLARYTGFEGVIQQYIFYYGRSRAYRDSSTTTT